MADKINYDEYTCPELVIKLGHRFKEYRILANLTQKEVSEYTGLGLTTIRNFETGRATNLSLTTFFWLLKAIGCINDVGKILPELPPSPYAVTTKNKQKQRIRH